MRIFLQWACMCWTVCACGPLRIRGPPTALQVGHILLISFVQHMLAFHGQAVAVTA